MKKKIFRERYNINELQKIVKKVYEETPNAELKLKKVQKVLNDTLEVSPEEPKKRGRKSVKSDK